MYRFDGLVSSIFTRFHLRFIVEINVQSELASLQEGSHQAGHDISSLYEKREYQQKDRFLFPYNEVLLKILKSSHLGQF